MHIPIGKPFGAHIVKVVGGLQFPPVPDNRIVVRILDFLLKSIQFGTGVSLHGIAQPRGKVPFNISPANGLRDINDTDRLIHGGNFRGGFKIVIPMFKYFFRKMPHKTENAGVFPLMFAKGFIRVSFLLRSSSKIYIKVEDGGKGFDNSLLNGLSIFRFKLLFLYQKKRTR